MLILLLILCPATLAGHMETMYSWKAVDFVFPSEEIRTESLANGDFIPENNLIIDVDTWAEHGRDRKMFVTMPKFKVGAPVTLAMVTDQQRDNVTLLQPYPDWSWHQGDCDGINSVFRTHVDRCGRLWVLDCSVINIFTTFERKCPPQLLIFDPRTDTLIKRYKIPDSDLDHRNLLLNIAVDTRTPDCSDAFAYISDAVSYKLIVYDSAKDKSWRASGDFFGPYEEALKFHTADKHYKLNFGMFGLALGPLRNNGDRTLYFHSLTSVKESWVTTSVLRNSQLFLEDPDGAADSFHEFNATRSSQSAAEDMSDCGIMLYSLVGDNAIGCWNSRLPFEEENMDIVAKDDERLQFQSGLKIYGDDVWTLSCRFQNFYLNQVPNEEVNYRINKGRLSELVKNTRCDPAVVANSHTSAIEFHYL
ncbi:protein yellow-like [Macrosteles quadrilineatus]|uniref:protein yellow-like n=1 Tax=Macrosteles quadrilineatus TaxID=74068 RepID=UPI0023E0E989|nr:protein yellow-like [Macrosteles quadrilineatus]